MALNGLPVLDLLSAPTLLLLDSSLNSGALSCAKYTPLLAFYENKEQGTRAPPNLLTAFTTYSDP